MKIKALRDMSEWEDSFGNPLNLQELVRYRHGDDAGIDLINCQAVHIKPGHYELVPSGIAIEIPSAHFALILPRSSLAMDKGIQILGGVIDNGYRGEIMINLYNAGKEAVVFRVGDRVAQLVVLPYYKAKLEWLEEWEHVTQTSRGYKGHGSTGI